MLADGKLDENLIGGAIGFGKVEGVSRFKSCLTQLGCEPSRELSINEKLHAEIGSMRFIWLSRLAKSSAARMSSRSRSS